ncbi:unnamed protein product [Linum tenue]|uniref:Man1/Src1-like C-terminal domain-containing protein n=1 Tax=Linum tenue TaxID=586396 RepID=A0AAV0K8H0_9ROSI|nr:unnamed protein product [Linum tenue]
MSSTHRKRPNLRPEPQFRSKVISPSIMEPPGYLFPPRHELFRLLVIVGIASSVAFTCNLLANYFSPTSPPPFCDSSNLIEWFSDVCEPCPMNGECQGGKLVCDDGYRRNGNLCLEDGESNERAKKLAELVESYICESYAQFSCYGRGRIWVPENEMWEDVKHQVVQIFHSDDASYIYAKNKAMEIIDRSLEKKMNREGITELKCPSDLAERYKPVSCRVQQWIFEHAFVILPVCAMVIALTWLVGKIRQRCYLSTRGEELYHQVCDMLEEIAFKGKRESGEFEPWVVASQLRDHLLLPKERKNPLLWKKVEELVQEDSRIDQYPKLVKGESKVVWEWQVEGSLSSAGKRTKNATVTKLRSNGSTEVHPDKQTHTSKSGQKLGMMF